MRHPSASLVVLAALALFAAGAASRAVAAPHLVRTLPNKATLIVRENRTRPVAVIQVWIKAGTGDETRPERGAAGVLAQLPWLGSAKRSSDDVARAISMFAGSSTSEVGADHILYEIEAPAREFAAATEILGDVVTHTQFNEKRIADSKSLAQSASRSSMGHAVLASMNPVSEALHPGSPLGAPRAVAPPEIGALTLPLIERFYRTWFVGGNVLIVVVGDVDPNEAADLVTRAFADLPNANPPRRSAPGERPLSGPIVIGAANPEGAGGAAVTIGFRSPAWGTADALALDALVAMLVDYGDARIQKRLGEGPFLGASAQRSFQEGGGSIAFSVAAPPESLADAEALLFGEIARARSTPIAEGEFKRTIETVLARDLIAQADYSGEARVTAITTLQGTIGGDEVYAQRLRALKPDDLVAVAREYLDPAHAVIVEMAPKNYVDSLKLFTGLEGKVKEKLAAAGATYQSGRGPLPTMSAPAERRRRVDAPLATVPKAPREAGRGLVTRRTLPGGIRLVTGPSKGPGVVQISILLEGSVRYETEKNNGVTRLLRETLLTTTDPRSEGRAYRFSLLDLGRLTPYQDRDMWGYSLTVPTEHWKEALTRLGAMLAKPELDSVTVDATRILVLGDLGKWLDDDDAQRRQLIFSTRYQISGYRLPIMGTPYSIVRLAPDSLEAFYRRYVVKPNMVVAVFGNVGDGDVAPAVTEAFRDVSGRAFTAKPTPLDLPFDDFREKWELGEGPTSTVTIAFAGPPVTSPDLPVLYVINSLFTNPKGWYQQYITDKFNTVLSVSSYVAQAADECPIVATVTTDGPGHEESATKVLFGQFRSVAAIPLKGSLYAADYENARRNAADLFQMGLASESGRTFQWARAALLKLPADFVDTFPTKLLAVTPEQIQSAGFEYFQFPTAGKRPYAVCETRPGGW